MVINRCWSKIEFISTALESNVTNFHGSWKLPHLPLKTFWFIQINLVSSEQKLNFLTRFVRRAIFFVLLIIFNRTKLQIFSVKRSEKSSVGVVGVSVGWLLTWRRSLKYRNGILNFLHLSNFYRSWHCSALQTWRWICQKSNCCKRLRAYTCTLLLLWCMKFYPSTGICDLLHLTIKPL